MNENRYVAINTHLLRNVLFFIVFVLLSVSSALFGEVWLAVGFGAFALVPVVAFFMSSLYFVFDDVAVKIFYNFGISETIKWNDIRSVSLQGSWFVGIECPHYEITYPHAENKVFFAVGEIPKTRKTTKLIKMFYKKQIEK